MIRPVARHTNHARGTLHCRLPLLALALLMTLGGFAASEARAAVDAQVRQAIDEAVDARHHPRLFLAADQAERVRANLEADPLLERAWASIRRQADAMLELEPAERDPVGRRLLGVSRTVLKRVSYLSLACWLTGERSYLERAEQEMLAVAELFSRRGGDDRRPGHRLRLAA